MTEPRTVQYFAISLFASRTFWFNLANLVVAALSMNEITTLIPPRYLPLQAAVVALVNMALRLGTVRPAAMIMPGSTTPVEVKRIGPPPPATPTD